MKSAAVPTPELSRLTIEKGEERKGSKTPTIKVSETCHDCWQCALQFKKRTDSAASAQLGSDDEDMEDPAESRILKEIPVKEFNISPAGSNSESMSSTAEGISEDELYND